jgi:hypothetical protein
MVVSGEQIAASGVTGFDLQLGTTGYEEPPLRRDPKARSNWYRKSLTGDEHIKRRPCLGFKRTAAWVDDSAHSRIWECPCL